jgi:hypothetical protein
MRAAWDGVSILEGATQNSEEPHKTGRNLWSFARSLSIVATIGKFDVVAVFRVLLQ